MTDQPKLFAVGTIGDAADRFGVDGAQIWEWISLGCLVTNPGGNHVRLIADPEKRFGPDGTTWLVEEEPA